MLIAAPIQFRKRRGRGKAPAAASGVRIYAVQLLDATSVMWCFSSTYDGDGDCAALMVNDGVGGWVSPDGVDAPDNTRIRAYYGSAALNLSSIWQLLSQIDGVTFADGLLIVPQSGVLVA